MKVSDRGLEVIRIFEGFSPRPYICPAGYLTIGYGHVVRPGEVFVVIDEGKAEELLREDVRIYECKVLKLIKVPLTQGQFDALVSFTYNLGAGALQRSTLRMKLNRGEYLDAADEFPKWVWAGGRKLRGLIRRRMEERKLFLS